MHGKVTGKVKGKVKGNLDVKMKFQVNGNGAGIVLQATTKP